MTDSEDKVKVEVVALLRYKSFKDLVSDFGIEYCGYPKNYSIDDFIDNIHTVYSKEKEQQ